MQYGQPFGDASAVPSFLVSRLAREHVKVCLSGDGGDESFGGYWRMQSAVYASTLRRTSATKHTRSVGSKVGGKARWFGPQMAGHESRCHWRNRVLVIPIARAG